MSRVRIHNFSISLDGFATGEGRPSTRRSAMPGIGSTSGCSPLGSAAAKSSASPGGTEGVDHVMADRHGPGIGAEIMGAGKFGPPGWQDDPEWRGWWGDNPPFHTPTYVLTHRPRPSLEMDGGTTFHFLDAAPADALEVARGAAAGQDVRIGGGPTMMRAFIAAGLVDHLHRRAGADPARPRCSAVGRPGGVGAAVRRGGSLDAPRRHPPHVHPMTRDPCVPGRNGSRDRPQPPGTGLPRVAPIARSGPPAPPSCIAGSGEALRNSSTGPAIRNHALGADIDRSLSDRRRTTLHLLAASLAFGSQWQPHWR